MKTRIKVIEKNNGQCSYMPQVYSEIWTSYLELIKRFGFLGLIAGLFFCLFTRWNGFYIEKGSINFRYEAVCETRESAEQQIAQYISIKEQERISQRKKLEEARLQKTKKVTYIKYP